MGGKIFIVLANCLYLQREGQTVLDQLAKLFCSGLRVVNTVCSCLACSTRLCLQELSEHLKRFALLFRLVTYTGYYYISASDACEVFNCCGNLVY